MLQHPKMNSRGSSKTIFEWGSKDPNSTQKIKIIGSFIFPIYWLLIYTTSFVNYFSFIWKIINCELRLVKSPNSSVAFSYFWRRACESRLYILVSFVNMISSFSVPAFFILQKYIKGQCHFLSHPFFSSLSFLTKVFNRDRQGFCKVTVSEFKWSLWWK